MSLSVMGPNLRATVQAEIPLKVHNTTTKSQTQVMALLVNSEVPFISWKDVTTDNDPNQKLESAVIKNKS
ncbi:hypothetical protein PanWU01x14_185800 [Parasponia andersonii]|uniref:Uncharacterized protein n=1 Tax=Parasponia andersonii TaxID=3476 RepID=A0A2P5C433_PARAD|nr:hypothetical protein PanWU01x14_185800 [Parasponia andersonii]